MGFFTNYILRVELDIFDLNGDNNFSMNERTNAKQQAMHAVILDFETNLAPIAGIIYSFTYFIIIIIPLRIFNKRKKINEIT